MKTTDNIVTQHILNKGRGSIFFPSDFVDIATPEATRQTLSRLVKNKMILRVCRGVYCYPRANHLLGLSVIPPSTDEIAHRIAERDRVKIIPTGDTALNMTGLSTQIPANAVYLTNGARKQLQLDNGRKIIFRESNELRIFDFHSRKMMLIVSAMRAIGENFLTPEHILKLRALTKEVSDADYNNDIHLAPAWVKKKIEQA